MKDFGGVRPWYHRISIIFLSDTSNFMHVGWLLSWSFDRMNIHFYCLYILCMGSLNYLWLMRVIYVMGTIINATIQLHTFEIHSQVRYQLNQENLVAKE